VGADRRGPLGVARATAVYAAGVDPSEYYKPPKAELLDTGVPQPGAMAGPLSSIRQITAASILGGPLAGILLMAGNLRAFGRASSARKAVIVGVAGSVVLIVVGLLLPEHFPKSIVPIACAMTVRSVATANMGADLAKHSAAGGPQVSNWRVAGIAAASLVAVLALALILALILPP
jgi:hypothetical protein